MSGKLTLSEYRKLAVNIPYLRPFEQCCTAVPPDTFQVEPLEGRNALEVDRTCIVQCPECKKLYLTRWD
jgi:hypothetical protein